VIVCPNFWANFYLHPVLGDDEVSGSVRAPGLPFMAKDNYLMLYDHTHSHVCFGLARADTTF
jgi:hypothetical protein